LSGAGDNCLTRPCFVKYRSTSQSPTGLDILSGIFLTDGGQKNEWREEKSGDAVRTLPLACLLQ
jgi:hypothetical protein